MFLVTIRKLTFLAVVLSGPLGKIEVLKLCQMRPARLHESGICIKPDTNILERSSFANFRLVQRRSANQKTVEGFLRVEVTGLATSKLTDLDLLKLRCPPKNAKTLFCRSLLLRPKTETNKHHPKGKHRLSLIDQS